MEGLQVGPEIDLLVFQTELASNVIPVKYDGIFRKTQQRRYLLCSSAISDQTGNLDFCGGKVQKFGRQLGYKWRGDFLDV